MADSVYRVTEIVGTSPDSVDQAIRNRFDFARTGQRREDDFGFQGCQAGSPIRIVSRSDWPQRH